MVMCDDLSVSKERDLENLDRSEIIETELDESPFTQTI